jgi:hypothetical protein
MDEESKVWRGYGVLDCEKQENREAKAVKSSAEVAEREGFSAQLENTCINTS